MSTRNNLPLAIAAIAFSLTVIYACMSKKTQTGTTTGTTPAAAPAPPKPARILVFSKTSGFYHQSIPVGRAAMVKLGQENNMLVDTTTDARYFVQDSLQHYAAVMFLSTTMNVLNGDQQTAFERYIQAGGGFVGVHAAADTEYDWPWYNKLVGAYFMS